MILQLLFCLFRLNKCAKRVTTIFVETVEQFRSTNQTIQLEFFGCLVFLSSIYFSILFKWPRSRTAPFCFISRYQFTVIRDVESFPKILEENLTKHSLSVIFTGDIDPATGKSWYIPFSPSLMF